MPAARYFSRSEPLEIKSQIERNIGCLKAERYFDLLSKFLGVKIGRSEFERLLIGTIGRENVHLHNHLLRSVLKSACLSKTAPPNYSNLGGALRVKVLNEHRRCFQSLCRDFPQSPRKARTLNLGDRKIRDRPSPLGPHGKGHSKAFEELIPRNQEQQSANELLSLGSRPPGSVEDGEEVNQGTGSPSIHSRSPVRAPLGILVNTRGACKKVSNWFASSSETCHLSGELPDTNSLKKRLKQNLETEGINMSSDSANLLNSSLDTYLKRLIKPCLDLARTRSEHTHLGHGQPGLNQMLPSTYEQKSATGSILDFWIAMELNPSILGEQWPILLEKAGLLVGEECKFWLLKP